MKPKHYRETASPYMDFLQPVSVESREIPEGVYKKVLIIQLSNSCFYAL
jgi:hypothetical protein